MESNQFDPVYRRIIDGVAGYRSIWWQQEFWREAALNRVPAFQVQGLTDDLFPLPEAKRMLLALRTVDPLYPIASYFGDLGHPRASNKSAEVDYVLGLVEPGGPLRDMHQDVSSLARSTLRNARSPEFAMSMQHRSGLAASRHRRAVRRGLGDFATRSVIRPTGIAAKRSHAHRLHHEGTTGQLIARPGKKTAPVWKLSMVRRLLVTGPLRTAR